jgi:hypothetical protein
LSQEQNVHALHRSNLLNVLNAGGRFNLEGHNDVFVGITYIAQQAGLIGAALREVDGAGAFRRISAAADVLACFFRGVDVVITSLMCPFSFCCGDVCPIRNSFYRPQITFSLISVAEVRK